MGIVTPAITATVGTALRYVGTMPAKSDPTPSRRTMLRSAATQPTSPTAPPSAWSRRRSTSSGYVAVCAARPAAAPTHTMRPYEGSESGASNGCVRPISIAVFCTATKGTMAPRVGASPTKKLEGPPAARRPRAAERTLNDDSMTRARTTSMGNVQMLPRNAAAAPQPRRHRGSYASNSSSASVIASRRPYAVHVMAPQGKTRTQCARLPTNKPRQPSRATTPRNKLHVPPVAPI
mmetsp:Transcript_29319/g.90712  ORF Transcript_29319/g.90712 Transcript_29319/m.90712 type:complete len:235 (+) Transcript_29319:85-789(+)